MSTRSPRFEYQTKPGISINQPTNRQSLVMQRSEKSEASVCGKKVRMTPSQQIGRVKWIARSRGVLPGAFPVLEKQHCFSFKFVEAHVSIFCFSYVTLRLSGQQGSSLGWINYCIPRGSDAIGSICTNKRCKNTNPALNSMLNPTCRSKHILSRGSFESWN